MSTNWSDFQHEPAERSGVVNPIRQLLERDMKPPVGHPKKLINLGLGEPTAENGFVLPSQISDALIDAVKSGTANGYTQAAGNPAAREAVANRFSEKENPIDPNNVFLTQGTYGALYHSIAVMCERGDHILVPRPGFPFF